MADWCRNGAVELLRDALATRAGQSMVSVADATVSSRAVLARAVWPSAPPQRWQRGVRRAVTDPGDQGMLPLHWACDRGHVAVARMLVNAGADISARDANGSTSLHYAASCDHDELVRFLLDAGARTDILDDQGQAAIECTRNGQIRQLISDASKKRRPQCAQAQPDAAGSMAGAPPGSHGNVARRWCDEGYVGAVFSLIVVAIIAAVAAAG